MTEPTERLNVRSEARDLVNSQGLAPEHPRT